VSAEPVADLGLARLVHLDKDVDAAEGEGLRARWEFGRELLARRVGKQLPSGVLDEIASATGKPRSELQHRMRFAEKYATAAEVSTAVDTLKSWTEVRDGLYETTAQRLVASDENEWYTPARYIEHARAVLGAIDLDPASCEGANETVRAAAFFTKDDNGLEADWAGRVWLNPPYGRLAGDFTRKLLDEHAAGNVTAAIALVNAHCTDTSWFAGLWDHTLCFTDHRIDFDSGERGKTSSSTHGSVFAYLGPDSAKFADIFSAFGAVVSRWAA
jgi:phage N-6-adenine-methyltransferase